MYTYYLCSDNETIYRLKFSLKEEDAEKYFALLEGYMNELVYAEGKERKELIEPTKIENESKVDISLENGLIFLKKTTVMSAEEIEDNLPFIVLLKTKKYAFLRSYTICTLIRLLSKYYSFADNPHIKSIEKLLPYPDYIDFSSLLSFFTDESGNLLGERFHDFTAIMDILKNVKVEISERYSKWALINFWEGDEAERCIAEGIIKDVQANDTALNVNVNIKMYKKGKISMYKKGNIKCTTKPLSTSRSRVFLF